MDIFQVVFLSIIQGVTEFIPVSSSAHLVLIPTLTGWQDQGLVFDIALHVGSLLAVLVYFAKDLQKIIAAGFNAAITRKSTPHSKLFFAVGLATIPVGLAGLALNDFIETNLRSPVIIGIASIFFGILLYLADKKGLKNRDELTINWKDIVLIGMSQALALIPGTSRSGATMTAGLALGLTRKAAARFSFLLSIPVIILAGGFKTIELLSEPITVDILLLISSVVISAVVAYICIHFFLKLLDKYGMTPFVIYRIILGIILISIFS